MPIIFEGPDGAGKTTLIQQVVKEFNLPVMPRVVSKDTQAVVDLVNWVETDNDRPAHEVVIYDRHRLISEPIYGPILRVAVEPGFDKLTWLVNQQVKFFQRKPVIIYCLPPIATIVKNVARGDDNLVVKHKIRKIYGAYVARASLDLVTRPLETFLYSYLTSSVDDIFRIIQAQLALEGSL